MSRFELNERESGGERDAEWNPDGSMPMADPRNQHSHNPLGHLAMDVVSTRALECVHCLSTRHGPCVIFGQFVGACLQEVSPHLSDPF